MLQTSVEESAATCTYLNGQIQQQLYNLQGQTHMLWICTRKNAKQIISNKICLSNCTLRTHPLRPKSFPIESYHKFKYTVVFINDFSRMVVTTNIRNKNDTLHQTKQFMACLDNKSFSMKQWMPDQGEYTSKLFDNYLKD